ncbi:MAG: DUF1287 domain-containing protein [Akkermansiaceae bacterium]|jgi:uncharacterized protein YijF (DUF1287 family)
MSRNRSGFYSTIEYIGPRPKKPKKPSFFGGWVIVVIAMTAGIFFAKPWIGSLVAAQTGPTPKQCQLLIDELESSDLIGDQLAAEALRYVNLGVSYDSTYYEIPYPNGDIPRSKGMAADLIVRCYRQIGFDLQELVHQDMSKDFRVYPQLWQAMSPDENIDHRRVPNLQRYFSLHGQVLKTSRDIKDYHVGDIVVWALPNAEIHIGIVVPSPEGKDSSPWVVHHPQYDKAKWENSLFDYQILGHFSYPVGAK